MMHSLNLVMMYDFLKLKTFLKISYVLTTSFLFTCMLYLPNETPTKEVGM